MDDSQRLAIAQSFEELKGNEAFRMFMAYLRKEAEAAKGAAILTGADRPTKEVRNRFIVWQEREKIILGIEDMLDEQAKIKAEIEEEMSIERANAVERSSRAGW